MAPFYVREDLLDVVKLDRLGSLHIAEELGEFRYELYTDARKYGYATLAFGAVFQLRVALDYLLRVGVQNIERHTVDLAHRMRGGLVEQGYSVWTPAGNRSAIVTFEHGRDIERIRATLDAANVRVSLKQGGEKIRASVALFNNAQDIGRLLEVTGEWV